MPMQTLLIVFIVVTAVAVVIQMAILVALYVALKKSTARMEAMAAEVQTRALPTLDAAQSMITEYRPKIEIILNNVADTSTTVKSKVDEFEPLVSDIAARAHVRIAEIDDMLGRTLHRVQETTEAVQHSVSVPVRQASGVLHGLTTGLATLFGRGNYARGKKATTGTQKEDMFI